MKKDKIKTEKLKFKDLPKELSFYFIRKIIFCAFMMVGLILFMIFFFNLWKVGIVLITAYLFYVGYNLLNYISVITQKIKVYTGTVEKKEQKSLIGNQNQKSVLNLNGPCSLIVIPLNSENETKYIVPVGSGFACDKGNIVTIYSNPNEIYLRNNNSYYFNSPLLVSITKI